MAEPATIARPYARGVFESASDAGAFAAWSTFLERAAAVVADPQLQPLIGNPRVPDRELIALVLELATVPSGEAAGSTMRLTSAQLAEEQRNFLALLLHNQRLALLPQIALQFEALRAEAESVADIEVTSARALTDEQAAGLRAALERRFGRHVRLHQRVDAALLGGAVVHYGDYVIDGSLRRRVERLAAALGGA